MVSNGRLDVNTTLGHEESLGESWMMELVLPGLFTIVLLVCLGHLAVSAFVAQQHQSYHVEYAISAFAN